MANIEKIDSVVGENVTKEISDLQKGLNTLNSSMIAVLASTNNLYAGLGKTDTIKQLMAAIDYEAESTKKLKDLETQHTAIVTQLAAAQAKLKDTEDQLIASKKNAVTASSTSAGAISSETSKVTENIVAKQKLIVLDEDVKRNMEGVLGTRSQNIALIESEKQAINKLNQQKALLAKEEKSNTITSEAATAQRKQIISSELLHKQAISELQSVLVNEQKIINSGSQTYTNQSLILERLKMTYKQMTIEEQTTPIGKKTSAYIQQLDSQLKGADASMGNHQRSVGNYKIAWNGLGNSINQLTREMPAFANSMQTGFMAISNNIPILADEINNLRAKNAQLRADGEKTTPVWKQIVSGIFSWQTAISLAVTILTVYGKQMVLFIESLFKSETAIKASTIAQESLNNARTKGLANSQKERIELKLLYEAAVNEKKSKEERLAATNELQKQYPAYFKNLSDENIMVGKAEKVYNILTSALLKNAIAKAKLSELDKMATQEWDLSMKAAGKLMEMDKARINLQDIMKERNKTYAESEDHMGQARATERKQADIEVQSAQNRLASLVREYNALTGSIRSSEDAQIQLAKSINVKDLTLDVKGEKPKNTKTDNTLESNRKELEKSLEEERKLRINADKIAYTDENKSYEDRLNALKQYIQDSKDNVILSASAELKEENNKYSSLLKNKKLSNSDKEELEKLHNSKINVIAQKAKQEQLNIESEGAKSEQSILNKQYEEAKKNLDNEIKMMDNGYEKEAAIRSKASSDSLMSLVDEYKSGKISKQKYEDEKIKITQDYVNKELQFELDLAKKEVELLKGDEKEKKLKEIAKIEADISKQDIKNKEEQKKKDDELTKKRKENLTTWLDKSKEGVSAITGFVNALYEGQINNIQKDQDAYDESAKAKISIIEDQESKGTISSEQATARKKAITDAQTKYDEEAEKKKTALKKKQAILDKVNAIAQAGINTAVAITEALPNIPLAIAVGALGAIEVATIIATPLAYAKGTDNHPGGSAIVGDGGKSEMVITSKGVFKTPDKPTFLPDLEKGAMVLPDFGEVSRMLLNSSLRVGLNSSPTYNDQEVVNGIKGLNGELREIKSVLKRKSRNRDSSSDFQFQAYKNRILGQ